MYKSDPAKFRQTAKFWTETYAQKTSGDSAALSRLLEMGFSREDAVAALAQAGGDETEAVNRLLAT